MTEFKIKTNETTNELSPKRQINTIYAGYKQDALNYMINGWAPPAVNIGN